ncbi:MAG: ATP-binding cassette domain-containing protein [Chitinivibrionales bacterium]|nr:ATP-binding cassette domain-containing protein [Chitinivibrionales bacterium]MBD3356256.1 ATP-binding cassette domain-containing protein [Chitinivibrionales bacterium]
MTAFRYRVVIRGAERPIVDIDEFSVAADEITVLLGESGIGKSMISKAVYGLLDPDELSIEINGRSYRDYLSRIITREMRQNSFFVFQEPSSHLNALMKLSDQLREGSLGGATREEREILQSLWGTSEAGGVQKVIDIHPKPYRPSGGEKQRVLLAMAFKKIARLTNAKERNPRTFFVFDEPTGSLDDGYRNRFLHMLMERYRQKAFTILLITHDYSMISELHGSHKDLIEKVHFKELRRKQGSTVFLRDFSDERYLEWLRSKDGRTVVRAGANERVLRMAPAVSVFGRRLEIRAEKDRSSATELIIGRGEMVYLKAPSGVGKTTLAKVIMGLIRGDEYSLTLAGVEMNNHTPRYEWRTKIWGKRAGMLFQHADEALDLRATVKETFTGLPIVPRPGPDKVRAWLRELFEGEIDDAFLGKQVARLSGGQKQRLNLLRTLAMKTDLVILDEPLNGLDFDSITKVLTLLERKLREGVALMMISHNEEIFDALTDKGCVYHLVEIDKAAV